MLLFHSEAVPLDSDPKFCVIAFIYNVLNDALEAVTELVKLRFVAGYAELFWPKA